MRQNAGYNVPQIIVIGAYKVVIMVKTLTLLQMHCSWLPLSLGDATYYVPTCSSMSYFLASGERSTRLSPLHSTMYSACSCLC